MCGLLCARGVLQQGGCRRQEGGGSGGRRTDWRPHPPSRQWSHLSRLSDKGEGNDSSPLPPIAHKGVKSRI